MHFAAASILGSCMFLHFWGISILSSLKRPMRVSLSLSAFHIFVIILAVECHVGVTVYQRAQNKAPHKIKNLMGFFAQKGACAGNENAIARVQIPSTQREKQVLAFCDFVCVCGERARRVKYEILGSSKSQRRGDRNQPHRETNEGETAKSWEEIR